LFNPFEEVGMDEMVDSLEHVKGAKDLQKLTPDEQMLYVSLSVEQLELRRRQPVRGDAAGAAGGRSEGARRLHPARSSRPTRRANKGADAAIDFVKWVEDNGEAQGLSKEEAEPAPVRRGHALRRR